MNLPAPAAVALNTAAPESFALTSSERVIRAYSKKGHAVQDLDDISKLDLACSRVVAHDALYYGYDPLNPAEEIFMMQVIGLGLATTAPAKAAAYQKLAVLARSLARNLVWRDLNQQTLVKVAQTFARQFGQKLTKRKLGQFVPVAGVVIGAAMNYKMVDDVADAAYWAYRERFLLGKGAHPEPVVIDAEVVEENENADDEETAIKIVDILEAEGINFDDDPDPSSAGS